METVASEAPVNVAQSRVSNHLTILRLNKVVFSHRQGRNIIYRLNSKSLDHATKEFRDLADGKK